MKLLKYAVILLFSIGIMSCSGGDDKVDNTNPTIELNSPTGEEMINPGSVLSVNAVLSDDVELGEYVVTISSGSTKSVKNVEEFSFNSYTDTDAYGNALPAITGEKTSSLSFDIAIKDNARVGFYSFKLSVKDKSGNGNEVSVPIEISRP